MRLETVADHKELLNKLCDRWIMEIEIPVNIITIKVDSKIATYLLEKIIEEYGSAAIGYNVRMLKWYENRFNKTKLIKFD